MTWKNHIVMDPETMAGKPTIKGTRLTVELILGWLANGWSHDDLIRSYPSLTPDELQAVLEFVSERTNNLEPKPTP